MLVDPQNRMEVEIEGCPVRVASYPLSHGYLTEIECRWSGKLVARGAGVTLLESLNMAVELATTRLQRFKSADLTVGG